MRGKRVKVMQRQIVVGEEVKGRSRGKQERKKAQVPLQAVQQCWGEGEVRDRLSCSKFPAADVDSGPFPFLSPFPSSLSYPCLSFLLFLSSLSSFILGYPCLSSLFPFLIILFHPYLFLPFLSPFFLLPFPFYYYLSFPFHSASLSFLSPFVFTYPSLYSLHSLSFLSTLPFHPSLSFPFLPLSPLPLPMCC